MNITLHDALPEPMAEAPPDNSDVWEQEITFEQSERYLIVGESGCGKTTFMHMLCGLRRDYQGDLLLDGRRAKELSPFDWAALRAERAERYQGRTGDVGRRHLNGSFLITPTSGGAKGRAYWLLMDVTTRPPTITASGYYEDSFVRTPSGWRIKPRTLHADPIAQ